MDLGLAGRSALVIGDGSGIGAAVASALVAEGARVVVADRDVDADEDTVATLMDAGGEARFVRTDLTEAGAADEAVVVTERAHGPLEVAVNSAGVTQRATPLADTDDDLFEAVVAVNLTGTFRAMRAELRAMDRVGGGAIVNLASIASFTGAEGLGIYSATKHAVVGLTRSAALEHAQRHIRVNAVAPGTIETPMIAEFVAASGDPSVMDPIRAAHPLGRTGRPDEVTGAVLYLASDRASFTTDHTLLVDGGFVAR